MENQPSSSSVAPSVRNPKAITITVIIIAVIALAGFSLPAYFMFWPEYQRTQLVKNGLPAEATIVSIEPTGSWFNNQPQVRLRLDVQPASGETFQADVEMIISPVYLPQFQPGKTLKVRYDQNDRSKVAVEETESGQR